MDDALKNFLLSDMNVQEGSMPMKYLGVPLVSSSLEVLMYGPLINKIRKAISFWFGRLLSYAWRLRLIQVVLSSIPLYGCYLFRLLDSIINIIDFKCRSFLWGGLEGGRRNLVARKKMSSTFSKGGLG